MNRETVMDKEILAAFADGELTPEEAAQVVMHLADHPQDQAFVDDLMAANAALLRGFSAPMGQPVPDRFRDLITPPADQPAQQGATILAFPALRRRATVLAGLGTALAAAVIGAMVLIQPASQDGVSLAAGPVATDSPLHRVLAGQPSGHPVGFGAGQLTVLGSMPAGAGFCRELELLEPEAGRMQHALACNNGDAWVVDVAMAETLMPDAAQDDFRPASGTGGAMLDHWLERRGAGMVLTPQEEAAAIAAGWKG